MPVAFVTPDPVRIAKPYCSQSVRVLATTRLAPSGTICVQVLETSTGREMFVLRGWYWQVAESPFCRRMVAEPRLAQDFEPWGGYGKDTVADVAVVADTVAYSFVAEDCRQGWKKADSERAAVVDFALLPSADVEAEIALQPWQVAETLPSQDWQLAIQVAVADVDVDAAGAVVAVAEHPMPPVRPLEPAGSYGFHFEASD